MEWRWVEAKWCERLINFYKCISAELHFLEDRTPRLYRHKTIDRANRTPPACKYTTESSIKKRGSSPSVRQRLRAAARVQRCRDRRCASIFFMCNIIWRVKCVASFRLSTISVRARIFWRRASNSSPFWDLDRCINYFRRVSSSLMYHQGLQLDRPLSIIGSTIGFNRFKPISLSPFEIVMVEFGSVSTFGGSFRR